MCNAEKTGAIRDRKTPNSQFSEDAGWRGAWADESPNIPEDFLRVERMKFERFHRWEEYMTTETVQGPYGPEVLQCNFYGIPCRVFERWALKAWMEHRC